MTWGEGFADAVIHAAARLVPAAQRAEWRREWHAELASLHRLPRKHRRHVRRALGAFADAFWLRQRHLIDAAWIDDVRQGSRQLIHHGGFAAGAIAILSLGLAATITMFCVTDQVLLRPLPYPSAERIVTLWETRAPSTEALEVSPGNLLDWRARAQSFEFIAGVAPWSLDIPGERPPEVWFAARVTEGFFETFGVQPLIGRFFAPDEYRHGANQVLVLSESFWRRRFGGNPAVVGAPVVTSEGVYTVIGVAPAHFEPRLLPSGTGYRDVWAAKAIEEFEPRIRGGGYWAAVGRLKPGVNIDTAQAEMTAISQALAREFPRTNENTGARVMPLREFLVGNVRLAVQLLAGAVGLVLVIACVNVANLLLARGSAREREIAVRIALGARRSRIVQQLLIESALIASAGGLAGAALSSWALLAVARLGPASVPWLDTLHLDWRAAIFAALMSGAVAVLAGALPAFRIARGGLAVAGRATSTSDGAQHRLRAGLVVAEVALALVLVSGAGLLVRSFVGLLSVDPGFQRHNVLVAQVFAWDYNPGEAQLRSFFDRTIAQLRALPAVQEVGAVTAMPFIESNINIQGPFSIVGREQPLDHEAPRTHFSVATPGYFHAMRIPLVAGRYLEEGDHTTTKRVAVISQSMARRYWAAGDEPLGDVIRFRLSGRLLEVEVVGVVGAVRHETLHGDARDELFIPFAQQPYGSMTFVVRASSDASQLLEPTRATIWSVNPQQTIYRAATLDELVQKTISPRRFALAVVVGFAALALLLAIAGVYSVLSAIMTTRLREVGVRVALGASRWDIIRLVVGRGLLMTATGLLIGLAGAFGAGRLLQAFLVDVTPADPLALLSAAALMTVAALLACYVPARRAAAADPLESLRVE